MARVGKWRRARRGTTEDGAAAGRPGRDENGLVLVWTALFLTVLLGFASMAVDLGHGYYVSQRAQDAADAAALAGAPYLPGDPAGARDAAAEIAQANGFPTDGSDGVTFDATPSPDDPSQLNVTLHQDVPTWFARAIGSDQINVTRTASAVASQPSVTPVDMVLILDRTGSMKPPDLANVKAATLALLGFLNPAVDKVALGVLGASDVTQQCAGASAGAFGVPVANAASPNAQWIVAPYEVGETKPPAPLNDYQLPDGELNPDSQLVKTVNCMTTSTRTNLGDPVTAATQFLAAQDDGAEKDIILMTDGAANLPTDTSCLYADNAATAAKAAGITVATIGFGIADEPCQDTSGPYFPKAPDGQLLAHMASPIDGVAAVDNGCVDAENTDGDNYYCQPKTGDLTSVFLAAAENLTAANPRLIK